MNFIKKLETYPIGVCGTSLGLITLANCWNIKGVDFIKPIALVLATLAIIVKFIRMVAHHKTIWQELKNPILGSFYPTIDMVCFLLAASLLNVAPSFAKLLWLSSIVFHVVVLIIFSYFRIKDFKFTHIVPSWFVPPIGIVVATVASVGMGFNDIARLLFEFGFTCYAIMWPIILYRIFKYPLPEENKALIGIMAAPASLCLVGYLTVFNNYNSLIIIFLTVTSIFNLILVYTKLPSLLRKGFAITYASLTFPLAISILAMYKMSAYMNTVRINDYGFFRTLADIEILIGSYIIFYVVYHFLKRFYIALRTKN